MVKNWEDYQREIEIVNRTPLIGAVYPVAIKLGDGKGKALSVSEIVRWTTINCIKPDIALNYELARLGLLGGAVVDFKAMGAQTARMVVRVLRGEKPGNIPVEESSRFALVFNLARARQLGIEIPIDILMAADEIVTRLP
jgi:hypothetical protein